MKGCLRLEQHFFRGLKRIALHAALSALAHAVTALIHVFFGKDKKVDGWMVRKV